MFGWFESRVPVEPNVKRWVESRMGWLIEQFGEERIRTGPAIVPSDEYFPDVFEPNEDGARMLFERTCGYMDLDPAQVELKFYHGEPPQRVVPELSRRDPGWAGLYQPQDEKPVVWVDGARLKDPPALVSTFAHELCHVCLLWQPRLAPDAPDMEPLTDLATVYFGLGIFSANTSHREAHWNAGAWKFSRTSMLGYLAPPTWSYALAVYAWLRGEAKPDWVQFLSRTVRDECRAAIRYLHKTNDAQVVWGGDADANLLVSQNSGLAYEDTEEEDEQLDALEREMIAEADDPLADLVWRGIEHMEHDEWEAAVDTFSEVLESDPDDAEIYQHRSRAYLEMGLFDRALADAKQAVELDPEDIENWFARGMGHLRTSQFEDAVADLSAYVTDDHVTHSDGRTLSRGQFFLGQAWAGLNDFQQARRSFTKAINSWPNWPDPYLARAQVYEDLGQPDKAEADRQEADRHRISTSS